MAQEGERPFIIGMGLSQTTDDKEPYPMTLSTSCAQTSAFIFRLSRIRFGLLNMLTFCRPLPPRGRRANRIAGHLSTLNWCLEYDSASSVWQKT